MGMAAVHFRVDSTLWSSYDPDHTQRIPPATLVISQWVNRIPVTAQDFIARLVFSLLEEEHSLLINFFALYGPATNSRFDVELVHNARDLTMDVVVMVSFDPYVRVIEEPEGHFRMAKRLHPPHEVPRTQAPPAPVDAPPAQPNLRMRRALRGR